MTTEPQSATDAPTFTASPIPERPTLGDTIDDADLIPPRGPSVDEPHEDRHATVT
ncbi:MAG TPA: hypothetical protein VGD43_01895 [Micromonospora sp.]